MLLAGRPHRDAAVALRRGLEGDRLYSRAGHDPHYVNADRNPKDLILRFHVTLLEVRPTIGKWRASTDAGISPRAGSRAERTSSEARCAPASISLRPSLFASTWAPTSARPSSRTPRWWRQDEERQRGKACGHSHSRANPAYAGNSSRRRAPAPERLASSSGASRCRRPRPAQGPQRFSFVFGEHQDRAGRLAGRLVEVGVRPGLAAPLPAEH